MGLFATLNALRHHSFILVTGHTRGHTLFLLSLLEHGKEVTCILTYMFAQASAEKTNSKGKTIYSITSSGEGKVELKLSFGLLSPVFCFCSELSFQSFYKQLGAIQKDARSSLLSLLFSQFPTLFGVCSRISCF